MDFGILKKIRNVFYSKGYKKEWNSFIKRLVDEVVKDHREDGHCGICLNISAALHHNKYSYKIDRRISRKLNQKYESIEHTYKYRQVTPSCKMKTRYYWPSHKLIPRIGWLNSLKF